jgi:2'-5' RNA ligase
MARSPSRLAVTPQAEAGRWRVFLAIDIPEAVRLTLKGPLDALQPLSEWIRINPVERMHLTLHFLGHLPVGEVEQLPARLEPIVAAHPRFWLMAQGVGAFPNLGRAQVLWAGIVGTELPGLIAMQAELRKALAGAGLASEDRFHPHLTLARVRRPIRGPGRKLLQDWYARWREAHLGTLPVDSVRVMRSELGAGPPRYTALATFALK